MTENTTPDVGSLRRKIKAALDADEPVASLCRTLGVTPDAAKLITSSRAYVAARSLLGR